MSVYAVEKLMAETRRLAAEYRRATGKTLAVSGEIAVNDAIRLLALEPVADQQDWDAVRRHEGWVERLQIKGRVIFDEAKSGQRIGQLKLDRDWDGLIVVLMDDDYEPYEIYEASRETTENALRGKPANKRGAMSIAQFKFISRLVWSRAPASPAAPVAREGNG